MQPRRIEKEYAKLRASLDAIREILGTRATTELETPRTDQSSWSPVEHVVHLCLVNDWIVGAIDDLRDTQDSDASRDPEKRPRRTWVGRLAMTLGWIPRRRGKAPEFVRPEARTDLDSAREALDSSRARIDACAEWIPNLDSTPGFSPHHLFGDLSAFDWLRFARIHTDHHLKIIVDLLRTTA